MSAPRTTKNPRASKPSRRPSTTTPRASGSATTAEATLRTALARWPALTDVERRAFSRQHDPALCDALGKGTKSAGVLADALAWVPILDRALRAGHPELAGYKPARFVFFLEQVLGLLRARDAQAAAEGSVEGVRRQRDRALADARACHRELRHVLGQLATGSPAHVDALAGTTLAGDDPDALARSLGALVHVALRWIASADAEDRALVAASALTPALVAQAHQAIAALTPAASAAALGGARIWRDTAPVNRAEGHVLLEMRYAKNELDRAHEKNALIARLIPGAGTRSVLAKPKSNRAAASTAPSAGGSSATA